MYDMRFVLVVVVSTRVSHTPPPILALPLAQAYTKAKEAGKELEVVYVPVADSLEVRTESKQ